MAGDRLWITTLKFRKVEENSEIRRQVDNLINLATVLLEMILFCSKTRRMECDCFRHRTISDFRGPDLEGLRFILFFFFFKQKNWSSSKHFVTRLLDHHHHACARLLRTTFRHIGFGAVSFYFLTAYARRKKRRQ